MRVCNVETGLFSAPGASGGVFEAWQQVKPSPSWSSSQASRNFPGAVSCA
jgi:hypothetical protein